MDDIDARGLLGCEAIVGRPGRNAPAFAGLISEPGLLGG
jgi:hypothetical protein